MVTTVKPLFIVFEGIDGAGSTTQAVFLRDYFLASEQKAILSPEPTNGAIGKLIKQIMQEKVPLAINDSKAFDKQMAFLFTADRHHHLYNDVDGVFKSIRDEVNVISTRYYFSSLAYNCHTREDFKFISTLNSEFPAPDLLIYLDLPVEVSIERLKTRSRLEIYETREKLEKVRGNFDFLIEAYQGEKLVIDAQNNPIAIHRQIVRKITTMQAELC